MFMKGICLCGGMMCVCFRGYGYVEYETQEMARTAVERMNNVNFRGSTLHVSWVSVIGTLAFVSVLKPSHFGFNNLCFVSPFFGSFGLASH